MGRTPLDDGGAHRASDSH